MSGWLRLILVDADLEIEQRTISTNRFVTGKMLNVSPRNLKETGFNIDHGDSPFALRCLHSCHHTLKGDIGGSSPHDSGNLSTDSTTMILSMTEKEGPWELDPIDDDPDLAEDTELD